MLKENEIKTLIASQENHSNNELSPSNYLIQNVDNYNYLIHRELQEGENFNKEKTFEYSGKQYLFCISNAPTEEKAEKAIQSYWKAMQQLKSHL